MGVLDDVRQDDEFELGESLDEEDRSRKKKYISDYVSEHSKLLINTTESWDKVTRADDYSGLDLGFLYYQGYVLLGVAVNEARLEGHDSSVEKFKEEKEKLENLVDPQMVKNLVDRSRKIGRTKNDLDKILDEIGLDMLEAVLWIFANTPVDQENVSSGDDDSGLTGS